MWLRRALAWTPVAGGLLVQGLLLVRFAGDAMSAHVTDPQTFGGRWWHGNEPLFAFAGYGLVLVASFLLARAWTRVARPPRRSRRPEGRDDDAPGDEGEGAVAIEMPSFLRPKTRRTRPGAAGLVGWSVVGVSVAAAGAALGVLESLQMYEVLRLNAGDPSALRRDSTVWILRLMRYFAPAALAAGAAAVAVAWGVYWPLPPAREVVVGPAAQAAQANGPEWQTVE